MPRGRKYFNREIETMGRGELEGLIDERIEYTVKFAYEHSGFYRKWFEKNKLKPGDIKSHEDLLLLPIISGETIKKHQPPITKDFQFKSTHWRDIYTIHETSGTSGTPKSFFMTWYDWQRYSEKYSRAFLSQGFGPGDRVVMCASYGMNVGANTMTLAAKDVGMSIIPEGKCVFPPRVLTNYKPTGIIGSVFKLLRLARRFKSEGFDVKDSSVNKLVAGGESFAPESRKYLEEVWDCPVYNIYGSTEGTMCGECNQQEGLHVPEDLVHMDIYDPGMDRFVKEGECGRIVLTTLLPVGEKSGTLLLNYDTEDTTVVLTREKCACGRTHMKIFNPQREAETFWVSKTPFNRVDVESGVFQRENMEYLTGEYEAFIHNGEKVTETVLKINLEKIDGKTTDLELINENFLKAFLQHKPILARAYKENKLDIAINITDRDEMELFKKRGRPKRVTDRR